MPPHIYIQHLHGDIITNDNNVTIHIAQHTPNTRRLCPFIIYNRHKPMEHIDQELQTACQGTANNLVQYLRQAIQQDYIRIPTQTAREIYRTLNHYYGLNFSIDHFVRYWR